MSLSHRCFFLLHYVFFLLILLHSLHNLKLWIFFFLIYHILKVQRNPTDPNSCPQRVKCHTHPCGVTCCFLKPCIGLYARGPSLSDGCSVTAASLQQLRVHSQTGSRWWRRWEGRRITDSQRREQQADAGGAGCQSSSWLQLEAGDKVLQHTYTRSQLSNKRMISGPSGAPALFLSDTLITRLKILTQSKCQMISQSDNNDWSDNSNNSWLWSCCASVLRQCEEITYTWQPWQRCVAAVWLLRWQPSHWVTGKTGTDWLLPPCLAPTATANQLLLQPIDTVYDV